MTEPDRTIEQWTTIRVAALPAGWRNIYRLGDGVITEPAPALLLQEHRADHHCYDVVRPDGTTGVDTTFEQLDPPYETRVRFAAVIDDEVDAAVRMTNYVTSIGPDKHTEDYDFGPTR